MTATITRSVNPTINKSAVIEEHQEMVRAIIARAEEAGKTKLSKAEDEEVRYLLANRPIGCFVQAAKQVYDAVAAGEDVMATAPNLVKLLEGGVVAALLAVAHERRTLQDAFEQTAFYRRSQELRARLAETHEAYQAVKDDEDCTDRKRARLLNENEAASVALNRHINSSDPELVEFRRAMKPTAQPSLDELKWQNFRI